MNLSRSILLVTLFTLLIALTYQRVTFCDEGFYGYYFDGQKCENCMSSQCSCTSYLGCSGCMNGYALYPSTATELNPQNCYECQDNYASTCCAIGVQNSTIVSTRTTACTTATSTQNYALQGHICQMIPNCLTYDMISLLCLSCANGYFVDQNSYCSPCNIQYCQQCVGPNQCNACLPGYYLAYNDPSMQFNTDIGDHVASYCKPCQQTGCLCQSGNLCTGCISTQYYFSSNDKACYLCSSSITGCLTCTFANSAPQCQSCSGGYALNSTSGTCVPCPNTCSSCQIVSGVLSCICPEGQYTSGQNCLACSDSNAAICDQSGVTTECKVLTNSNALIPAPHTNQFYLFTNGNTKTCLQNINNCKLMNDSSQHCASCYTDLGYGLNTLTGSCQLCSSILNCVQCGMNNNQFQCTKCANPGDNQLSITDTVYVTNPNNQGSANWVTYVQNLATQNWMLDSTNTCKTLLYCLSIRSTDVTICDTCQTGFMKNSQGQCQACTTPGCISCNSNVNNCTQCATGYRLDFFNVSGTFTPVCSRCDEWCAQCNPRSICVQCVKGYYLVNGACQKIKSNCIAWTGNDRSALTCTRCDYGYRLMSNGWCIQCFSFYGSSSTNSQLSTTNNQAYAGYVNCEVGCEGTSMMNNHACPVCPNVTINNATNPQCATGPTDSTGAAYTTISIALIAFILALIM